MNSALTATNQSWLGITEAATVSGFCFVLLPLAMPLLRSLGYGLLGAAFSGSSSSKGAGLGALPAFDNINVAEMSLSGVSSGGAMAIQMHVAYSGIITKVAGFAAPPYWCAMDNVDVAVSSCMKAPDLISVAALVTGAEAAANTLSIDALANLKKARVWLQSGTLDTVVVQGSVDKSVDFYKHWVPTSNMVYLKNISSEHSWITNKYGNKCDYLGTPYMNNCQLDGAGELLQHLYSQSLSPPPSDIIPITEANLTSFSQQSYMPPAIKPADIAMGSTGFLFVPPQCNNPSTACLLHVAFHGCEQGQAFIGSDFAVNTGLNEWAFANNMIVLYPQAISTHLPYNPKGCWDWWGYTNPAYASKLGLQMVVIRNMINALTAGRFP